MSDSPTPNDLEDIENRRLRSATTDISDNKIHEKGLESEPIKSEAANGPSLENKPGATDGKEGESQPADGGDKLKYPQCVTNRGLPVGCRRAVAVAVIELKESGGASAVQKVARTMWPETREFGQTI